MKLHITWLLSLLLPLGAWGQATVRACQEDTQQQAGTNLADALAAGGTIYFACPPGTTIRMTRSHVITVPTRIEGGNAVVLDGNNLQGTLLRVDGNTPLVLSRIGIRRMRVAQGGALPRVNPASVVHSIGRVELDAVTISESESPVSVLGDVVIRDSRFEDNTGSAVRGFTADVTRTRFQNNAVALSFDAGRVVDSEFLRNTAGALRMPLARGSVLLHRNRFEGNRGGPAVRLCKRGDSAGRTVTIRANRFQDNVGTTSAGAIEIYDPVLEAQAQNLPPAIIAALQARPPVAFALAFNRFIDNRGEIAGALWADLAHGATLTLTADQFLQNQSNIGGGAISATGGLLQITHALFADNHAPGPGGALRTTESADLVMANTLVVRNHSTRSTITAGWAALTNVTIADNAAPALQLDGPRAAGSRVSNSLLQRNAGGDCQGVAAGVFQGANLQMPGGGCPGATEQDAFLDLRYVPLPGSPAYGAGDPAVCASAPVNARDLSFHPRQGAACTLGAYEGPPLRHARKGGLRELRGAEPGDPPVFPPGPLVPVPGAENDAALRAQLLAALSAQDRTVSMVLALRIEVGQAADVFIIEHVPPDRWRLVRNPQRRAVELVSVGKQAWIKTTQGWQAAPSVGAVPLPWSFPQLADHVVALSEVPGEPRTMVGRTAWVNGASRTEGRIAIRIGSDGPVEAIRFEGTCSGQPCRILQEMRRDPDLFIELPR